MKTLMSVLFFILALVASNYPSITHAAPLCQNVLNLKETDSLPPGVRQWLKWEVSPTYSGWAQERESSPLPITRVQSDSVEIETLSDEDVKGLETVLDQSKPEIPWFQHPYNTDKAVPNSGLPPVEFGVAMHTASRTIVSRINGRLVQIKMPTDHPFGLNKQAQPGKVKMSADLKYSVARSKAIEQIDSVIGTDEQLIVQKEIAAVIDKASGNGYLFRDLSALEDGHYYLSAHLIPTIGKELAEKHGSTMADYWKKHWASAIGRIQAKLLYRYGIEVREVNPQNFVIQLDEQMNPTGVVIWRDLAESHLIEPIASHLGLSDYIDRDMKNGGWGVHAKATIKNVHLTFMFNYERKTISDQEFDEWKTAHDQAFKDEIESTLGIKIPVNTPLLDYLNLELGMGHETSELVRKIIKWHKDKGHSVSIFSPYYMQTAA